MKSAVESGARRVERNTAARISTQRSVRLGVFRRRWLEAPGFKSCRKKSGGSHRRKGCGVLLECRRKLTPSCAVLQKQTLSKCSMACSARPRKSSTTRGALPSIFKQPLERQCCRTTSLWRRPRRKRLRSTRVSQEREPFPSWRRVRLQDGAGALKWPRTTRPRERFFSGGFEGVAPRHRFIAPTKISPWKLAETLGVRFRAGADPFAKCWGLITHLINGFQAEAASEASASCEEETSEAIDTNACF